MREPGDVVLAPGSDVLPLPGRVVVSGARLAYRIRRWIGTRHNLAVEALILVGTYVAYDAARGLPAGGRVLAVAHAREVYHLETVLGLDLERSVQQAATGVPGLMGLFGFGYDVFHLGVTLSVLVWVYFRRRHAFARVRTALLVTSFLALVGFVVFPAAPPRLAGIGLHDSLHLGRETATSGLLQFLYNPYAAMPSLHLAYAVLAGGALVALARHRAVRVLGLIYPAFVVVEVLATGNHFVLDLAAGVVTAVLGVAVAVRLAPAGPDRRVWPVLVTLADRTVRTVRSGPAPYAPSGVAVPPPSVQRRGL